MENYREKLKIHNILYGIGALALLAIQVLAFTGGRRREMAQFL